MCCSPYEIVAAEIAKDFGAPPGDFAALLLEDAVRGGWKLPKPRGWARRANESIEEFFTLTKPEASQPSLLVMLRKSRSQAMWSHRRD
jgi:hypothetical protein